MIYDFNYFFASVTGMPSKQTYQLMLKTTDEISRIIRVMSLLSIQAFPSVNLLPYIPTERERKETVNALLIMHWWVGTVK